MITINDRRAGLRTLKLDEVTQITGADIHLLRQLPNVLLELDNITIDLIRSDSVNSEIWLYSSRDLKLPYELAEMSKGTSPITHVAYAYDLLTGVHHLSWSADNYADLWNKLFYTYDLSDRIKDVFFRVLCDAASKYNTVTKEDVEELREQADSLRALRGCMSLLWHIAPPQDLTGLPSVGIPMRMHGTSTVAEALSERLRLYSYSKMVNQSPDGSVLGEDGKPLIAEVKLNSNCCFTENL